MSLCFVLDTLYPTLNIPWEISTLIQSWAGTVPGEFRNIKKGVSFLNSVLEEVVEEENAKIKYNGVHIEEEEFIFFKKNKGGGSFESPIITIHPKYTKECLAQTTWASLSGESYYYRFVINLKISTQIIQNILRKINAFVYERKETPLNLSFQQAVKRRETYDDRRNLYPLGPWSLARLENCSFRITVTKSAVCPLEYFTETERRFYCNLHPWYTLQQEKAKAQNSSSCIY